MFRSHGLYIGKLHSCFTIIVSFLFSMSIPFDNGRSIDTTFILVRMFRRVFRAMVLSTSIEPLIGLLVFFPGDAVAAFREAGSKVPSLRPLGCGPTRLETVSSREQTYPTRGKREIIFNGALVWGYVSLVGSLHNVFLDRGDSLLKVGISLGPMLFFPL